MAWPTLTALAALVLSAAPLAHAAAAERRASMEDCAIIARVAHSQFQNRRGIVPLHLQAHVPAHPAAGTALRDIQGSAMGQYFRDYFPQLPSGEAADIAAAVARQEDGFSPACDWAGLGLTFADTASVVEFEEPAISADDRYAIETSRYSSEAMGSGGTDCLLENRAGGWSITVCRPASGRAEPPGVR